MTIHQKTSFPISGDSSTEIQPLYGERSIGRVNWIGLKTLYLKEVHRFMKVQLQTVWGPAITTLLFLAIFTVALARGGFEILGVPFADFVAPGLIIMAMLQNSFANSSFSFLSGKIMGTIVDYLMPPLSNAELLIAMIGAAVTRAVAVGAAVWLAMLLWPGVNVSIASPAALIYFGLVGSIFVGLVGILTSIWAEKFDHAAAVTNFIIAPLSLLSGTFYSIDRLSPIFQSISHANPFFYIISGFRYGFLGRSDSDVVMGAIVMGIVTLLLAFLTYRVLVSGWRLRA